MKHAIELVYRLRTCAAALAGGLPVPSHETADLLVEASNLLDVPEPIGEPMEVLRKVSEAQINVAQWGGGLNATAQPCPSCGSVDARTVRRNGKLLQITCPKCAHQWGYGK